MRKVVDRDWVELAVADTGIGMTAEQQGELNRAVTTFSHVGCVACRRLWWT